MDKKENKNPWLAGLVNVLLPGASQLYVNKDWSRFVGAFVINILALAATIALGNLIEHSRSYSLPQGLCMGILILIVIAALFAGGYNTARVRNNETDASAFYNSKRHVSHASNAVQHGEIQKMRDEGLISELEYKEKNAEVESDKK